MSRLRVHNFSISLDGFGAGSNQDLKNPLGEGGESLHEWFIRTRTFQQILRKSDGETGVDDDFASRSLKNVGAWILGRNMFGPIRGPWPDDDWKGWWGKNPPYHCPVFVLTNYERSPIEMEGGTTFRFVTEGIDAALRQARNAAGKRDVQLGGGVATIRQYLEARLIDELHFAISPMLLGSGEHLLAGINVPALGYRLKEHVTTPAVTHVVLERVS
jgi:dihydrofolate reductase